MQQKNKIIVGSIKLEKGSLIDVRDTYKVGTYYLATILKIKKAGKQITEDDKLIRAIEKGKKKESLLDEYSKLKGILIHYNGWDDKWDEWIYTHDKFEHRLAAPNTI